MNAPDIKLLKKLADACRKAGIETFEGYGFKFTLGASVPENTKSAKKAATFNDVDKAFESDTLTPEQLLHWSVGDIPGESVQE